MNLENLKKQAKSLLRQHREGHFPVAARIRRSLPTHAAMNDREILRRAFGLHDAQQVIAAENGFRDWATLKQESVAVSNPSPKSDAFPTSPRLCCAQPQLIASDVTRLAEYYRDQLGFKIDYLYGDPPFYGLVSRDGAHLNLRRLHEDVIDRDAQAREQLFSAAILTENVKALFLEYQARGIEFAQTLKRQPWDAEDFVVQDPDRNLVCFASPT
ncbi:MAG: VOC family protein [Planctomycetota bacterium]